MLYIDNLCNIHITRGDTGKILFGVSTDYNSDVADFVFDDRCSLNFSVYNVNEIIPVFVMEFTSSDVVYVDGDTTQSYIMIPLNSDITNLIYKTYQYDIKLFVVQNDGSVSVDTVVTRSQLYLED